MQQLKSEPLEQFKAEPPQKGSSARSIRLLGLYEPAGMMLYRGRMLLRLFTQESRPQRLHVKPTKYDRLTY